MAKFVIDTELNTKTFDAQISKVENELEQLEKEYAEMYEKASRLAQEKGGVVDEQAFAKARAQIEETRNKLVGLYQRQIQLNSVSKDYGNSFGNTIKKIGKMGLAVFGIRSAYSLILRSANELASQNDQIAGKMNAIKGSLTNLIAPVTEVLVNLVYKLLSYLNVITKKFFNIDLFKKTAKSGKSAVGSAQKLKKTLAGFDEMNVLNDNSSSGGGGGGADIKEPPMTDTSKFQEFVDKYSKMWEDLLAIDRTEMAQMMLEQDKTWGVLKLGWFDTIQGIARVVTGFIDIFKGIGEIIVGIANGDEEKIKEGVMTLITGIGQIILGLVQAVLGLGEMILGAVWGIIKSILDWVYNSLIKPIGDAFVNMWNNITTGIKTAFTTIKTIVGNIASSIKDTFTKLWDGLKNTFSKFAQFFKDNFSKAWSGVKALFTAGGKIFDGMKEGIANVFKNIVNAIISGINKVIAVPFNAINKLLNKIHDIEVLGVTPFSGLWSRNPLSVPKIPKLAKGGIINMPSRGVPIAYGGEKGQEGVIPLTDSQQMALLGEAIGKYITINASITNTMNGRIISRELQKIQNENSFANNR